MRANDPKVIPYEAGRDAFEADAELIDNPYPSLSPDWHDWRKGWIDASEDDWTKRQGEQ
ncbi:hypothetical protein [Burkholderia ubonensis]|uniref:hypothetical protein n=1 Tax=Burkholderia ubonensis TaxID=101571 RepID=UPI000A60F3D5|nr:hypothetical protein [Burkholderia ubonensis]